MSDELDEMHFSSEDERELDERMQTANPAERPASPEASAVEDPLQSSPFGKMGRASSRPKHLRGGQPSGGRMSG